MSEYHAQVGSAGKGIIIGVLSALGSAILAVIVLSLFLLLRYTSRGRIFLDSIGRPGQFDDEQAFLEEEERALEEMNDLERTEYLRAKAFTQANPPETMQTDISLGQFLAIQEKGVSAWEFEPELEIANCFVEGRTEIEFFDMECCVQTNLPVPKQNEVYYWEAKIFEKPETTTISVGMTTKPYPLFRLPGYHKTSLAYLSTGDRRFNQPFRPTHYGPKFSQGDVIGVGYRPRSGTIFFTRNGKRLDDMAHGLKSQNFFPTIGATGPCSVHVNFGQLGYVFIEANVKKWGLAPMTGSLAPPPPYGSEAGSTLLETGADKQTSTRWQEWQEAFLRARQQAAAMHAQAQAQANAANSGNGEVLVHVRSPSVPERSPTAISLAPLNRSGAQDGEDDVGEGSSGAANASANAANDNTGEHIVNVPTMIPPVNTMSPPPAYTSPAASPPESRRGSGVGGSGRGRGRGRGRNPAARRQNRDGVRVEQEPLLSTQDNEDYEGGYRDDEEGEYRDFEPYHDEDSDGDGDDVGDAYVDDPPIPSYDSAIRDTPRQR
ncbi:Rsp5p-dependent ubiquitination, sorting of cargo proteins at the multivesicular body [Ascosphaera atra]|nr:Rsp5p-dependent ubiquitination, sorting of cargo proteins at the multivesicular body [Ascosphaera atra]